MRTFYERARGLVWDVDLRGLDAPRRVVLLAVRIAYVVARDLLRGDLNLRAMSLVYTTLLSLVPLLAVSFSVLKGFGVHNQIEPLLYGFVEPLGPKGTEVADRIIEFVDNVKVGVLGSLGLGLLIYTVISLLQKIESAFNFVWRVDEMRGFAQRFSSYLSVILIGPVLVFTAMGLTASILNTAIVKELMELGGIGALLVAGGRLVPSLLVVMAFTFVYVFMPNTRVRLGPALVGGLVAGVLWESVGWVFAAFIASSTKYAAIYSSFAILIMLLIWLSLSWLILLLGAQVAFYVQHPQYVTLEPVRLELSSRMKEKLALLVMFTVADHHYHNRPPVTLALLVERLQLPEGPVQRILSVLQTQGFLTATGAEMPAYLPARAVETIGVGELLESVRAAEESRFLRADRLEAPAAVADALEAARAAGMAALDGRTLKDLVTADDGSG